MEEGEDEDGDFDDEFDDDAFDEALGFDASDDSFDGIDD